MGGGWDKPEYAVNCAWPYLTKTMIIIVSNDNLFWSNTTACMTTSEIHIQKI